MSSAFSIPFLWENGSSLAFSPLAIAGIASLALMAPTLLLLILDGRVLDDELLWLKPFKFQISMAVFCFTLAFAIQTTSQSLQSSLWLRIPSIVIAVVAIYELAFLAIQAGRGKRSHFNSETLFDQIGGSLMAAGASVLVGGAMIIGVIILIWWLSNGWNAFSEPLVISLALGLIIGGYLGGYTGSFIGRNAGPFVGAYDPNDPTILLFGWSQTIGDLRIAHFLGLHAMQALPFMAIGLLIFLPPVAVTIAVFGGALGWIWLTLSTLSAAQSGQPPFFL